MSRNRGLPRLQGGIAKAWREAWEGTCPLRGCGKPAAGVIETARGPRPVCADHIQQARDLGYRVCTERPESKR